MVLCEILALPTFALIVMVIWELRAIRKILLARENYMPHWVAQWLESERAIICARKQADLEYMKSMMRPALRKLKMSGNAPLNEDQIGNHTDCPSSYHKSPEEMRAYLDRINRCIMD